MKSRDQACAEALAIAGYDFIVADMEHSPLSVADAEGIVRACDCYDVPVIARIPATGLSLCGQLLDAGVTGIQVSDVSSAAGARAARAAVHYPPLGERSLSLSTRAAWFGATRATAHIAASLDQTVLVGQIESADGLAALDEIIRVGGVRRPVLRAGRHVGVAATGTARTTLKSSPRSTPRRGPSSTAECRSASTARTPSRPCGGRSAA